MGICDCRHVLPGHLYVPTICGTVARDEDEGRLDGPLLDCANTGGAFGRESSRASVDASRPAECAAAIP